MGSIEFSIFAHKYPVSSMNFKEIKNANITIFVTCDHALAGCYKFFKDIIDFCYLSC